VNAVDGTPTGAAVAAAEGAEGAGRVCATTELERPQKIEKERKKPKK
jgi:hypothetical protein